MLRKLSLIFIRFTPLLLALNVLLKIAFYYYTISPTVINCVGIATRIIILIGFIILSLTFKFDVGQKISEDCFWKLYSKSKGFFIKNGRLMRYMKRRFIPRTPGWIAKIDSSHGSIQRWSKERDYYGKSAEEAVYSLLKSNNLL